MKLRPGATYAIRSDNSSTLGLVVCNAAFRAKFPLGLGPFLSAGGYFEKIYK
jgi:hypothetical protein